MSGGRVEVHKDDYPIFAGKHKRTPNSASLIDPGADFKSSGAEVGSLIKNTTDGSEGAITSVSEDQIGVTLTGGTDNDWDVDDEYEIYITDTEDSIISTIWTDKRFGGKVTKKSELHRGLKPEDIDLDEWTNNVWGPGQPSRKHTGV